MGSQHNLDSFTKLHLPPTFPSSSQTSGDTRSVPFKITPTAGTPAHTPSYVASSTGHFTTDIVKQESEKSEKTPKPRKKRGQYKKTILRQQAEAAAAAAAAGLPPPQFPPLPTSSRQASSPATSPSATPSKENGRADQQSSTASAIEGLNVLSHRSSQDNPASPTALEMERELAMLAEEAEEDKRRREEEAADRILKRAQVVKHLRSLKSKLATAQIQIGHDLRYQSIDLFSQLYDEVLEDIGRDNNSEMLNLLENSLHDEDHQDLEPEDLSTTHHSGHMLTRSSGKPKKSDLVPNLARSSGGVAKHHSSDHLRHRSHVVEVDADSDNDSVTPKRIRRIKSGSQFIGQSWDVSSGGEGLETSSTTLSHRNRSSSSKPIIHLDLVDDIETSDTQGLERKLEDQLRPVPSTREELQLRQRQELEELQLQQRKDQEEFQRRQLEQLRELQIKQNEEIERFEAAKARHYRKHLEGLAEKRLKISQSHYSRNNNGSIPRTKQKTSYSSASMSYEFGNGFQPHSPDRSPSHSRSPSPSPPPSLRHVSRQSLSSAHPISISDQGLSKRHVSSSGLSTSRIRNSNSNINSLPISTMTLALTAMNERKKILKRAQRQQLGQDDYSDIDSEQSDQGELQEAAGGQRFLSPPIWSQKRSAPKETDEIRQSAYITNSSQMYSSSLPVPPHRQQSTADRQRVGSSHAPMPRDASYSLSPLPQTHLSMPDGSLSPNPNPKAKKRKNQSPTSLTSKFSRELSAGAGDKSSIGFDKTLLSHFEKWNPDEKTENFFDFVLSDPPYIDVDDTEVQRILNRERRTPEHGERRDLNATPTSNAFRWYQEQQKLAQELAQQPKIAPLRLTGDEEEDSQVEHGEGEDPRDHSDSRQHGYRTQDGSELASKLIQGEDPLAAFINVKKKPGDFRKPFSTNSDQHEQQQHDGNHSNENNSNQHVIQPSSFVSDSSSFLDSSPAATMLMLNSEDGAEDWSFQSFMLPIDEYLNHDQPLKEAEGEYDF
ncbi:hypothetical protein EDD21DRAFT_444971 [Dissophora ornata]|nr:hypothetical protein BGZ58_006209 [Dissophora ornata]KAI8599904.1 hypothetical protein EDD21DRAFT_444971 [Dissophora ornata]